MIGLLLPSMAAALLALALHWPHIELPRVAIRWWPLALGAFTLELLIYNPPLDQQPGVMLLGPWLWVLTKLIFMAVLLRNARAAPPFAPALRLAAFGVALNTVVIVANGGYMPQSTPAAVSVWGAEHVAARRSDVRLRNVTPMTHESQLPFLADVIAQPAWVPRPNVISVGDLALALGIAWWVFAMLAPARARTPLVYSEVRG